MGRFGNPDRLEQIYSRSARIPAGSRGGKPLVLSILICIAIVHFKEVFISAWTEGQSGPVLVTSVVADQINDGGFP
jgi:hypothetical protein